MATGGSGGGSSSVAVTRTATIPGVSGQNIGTHFDDSHPGAPMAAPAVAAKPAAPVSSDLTGIATHIATNNTYSPAFVKALQDMQQHDPTFQSRLNDEVNKVSTALSAKQGAGISGYVHHAIPALAHGAQKAAAMATGVQAVHGTVMLDGKPVQGQGDTVGVPFLSGIKEVLGIAKAGRTAEEAESHLAEAAAKAKIEGFGGHVGGKGRPPIVVKGVATEGTDGDLGRQIRESLVHAPGIRNVQKAGYSEVRAERVAAGSAAHQQAGGGIAGHLAAMRHQEGSMGAEFFSHLKHFTPQQVDEAARVIDKAPLQFWEQRRAVAAIRNAVDSGVTPTESDQALLERVFGKVAPDAVAPAAQSKGDVVRNLLNVPRALKSTLDFSAPFRQGLVMGVHNPKVFVKAFGPMFKAWMSEDNFQVGIMDEIHGRSSYPLMEKAGVPFTEIGRNTKGVGDISAREEAFMTNYAERLPLGIGNIVRRSDRAYVGFLDRIRADSFDSLTKKLATQGYDLNDEHLLHSVGDFIGSATGRGNLPALQAHAASLNALLFSPRLMMSRLNFLGFGGEGLKSVVPGSYYMSLHPAVRVEAWKSLIALGATSVSILELARLGGMKVVSDPTNADFGKVKAGNTRFDILGGFQQYIRLGAELSEQKITSSTNGTSENLGSGFGKSTTMDILKRFFEGKLSPVPSALASAAEQSSFTGSVKSGKFWKGQAPIPFMAQDVYEALRTPGVPLGAKIVGPVVDTFGVGMQSYAAKAPNPRGGTGGSDSGYGDQGSGYGDTGSYGDNSTGGYGG